MFRYHYITETDTHLLFVFFEYEKTYLQLCFYQQKADDQKFCVYDSNMKNTTNSSNSILLEWLDLNCKAQSVPLFIYTTLLDKINSSIKNLI